MKSPVCLAISLFVLIEVMFLSACQKMDDDVLSGVSSEEANLKVTARASGVSPISYPIYLYAFSDQGSCVATQQIDSEKTPIGLKLAMGNYHVVAVSGVSKGYVMPEKPTLDDEIKIKDSHGAATAMMVGSADVTVGAKDNSVNLKLTNVVTSVKVELKKIPSGVTAVQVALSPLYAAFSFNGAYGNQTAKLDIPCHLGTDGVWTSDTYYFFPGSGSQTTLSIVLNKGESTETYGYTSQRVPEANHPFILGGSYAGNVTVGGTFLPEGWAEPIEVDFVFGGTTGEAGGEEDEGGDVDPSKIPEIGSIWNDCIVADVGEPDSKGVDLLLMSLEEWQSTYLEAEEAIAGYEVNGISNWRLPVEMEAKLLKSLFSGSSLAQLNEKITQKGFLKIDDGEEVRYLCYKMNIPYSFRFLTSSSVTKAGTTKIYNIRAVKTYHLSFS